MENIQHFLGFPELWWGEIIVVVVIVAIAFVLSRVFRNAGSLVFFVAAWLLYFLFREKTEPHESWLIDLQWPWLVIVIAIIAVWFLVRSPLQKRREAAIGGSDVDPPPPRPGYPVAAGLLTAFVLYTSLFLPMTWFYDHIWGWLGALISWLIPFVFWGALVIGMIGVVVYNHSDTGKGADTAKAGRNVALAVVVFVLLFTLLGPFLHWVSKGADSWWHDGHKDNPDVRTSLGATPPTTAVTSGPTDNPSSQPTADENQLSPETLAALQDMADDESFKCTAYGVELEENRLSKSGDVDQDLVVFNPGFTQSRQSTDAIQLPLKGANAAEMLVDRKKNICVDPLDGTTLAVVFARQPMLLQSNDWLVPFNISDDEINAKVAKEYLPYFGQANLTPEQLLSRMEANVAYQTLANKLGSMLNNFVNAGVQKLSANQTWHLANGLAATDGIPEVRQDTKTDTKPALILEVRQKNDTCVVLRIGFNTTDQRPEVFPVPSCAKQAEVAKAKAAAKKAAASTPKPATTKSTSRTSTSSSSSSSASKPPTANECKIDWQEGCPPNVGDQDLQSNDTDTGTTDQDGSPDPTSGTIVIPSS